MKQVIFSIMIGLVLIGCSFKPQVAGQQYYGKAGYDSTYVKVLSKKPYSIDINFYASRPSKYITFVILMKEAGHIGAYQGYKYFALINPKMNNVLDFPITTVAGIMNYCSVGDCRSLFTNNADFKVVYFKTKPKNIFSWSIAKALNYIPSLKYFKKGSDSYSEAKKYFKNLNIQYKED